MYRTMHTKLEIKNASKFFEHYYENDSTFRLKSSKLELQLCSDLILIFKIKKNANNMQVLNLKL